ncbi:hypothetical protein KY339_04050 [Candidatus Woesearchaeota archaeon]|nr:hypothetical protein [Candidatus Woesearchaeota archaeon]
MKKTIVSILLLILVSLFVFGCQQEVQQPTELAEEEVVESTAPVESPYNQPIESLPLGEDEVKPPSPPE